MTQEANNSIGRVEIFDQAFSLRGDPDYIRELAEHVDTKMRAIAEENPHMTDSSGLGVLAALNIADEYHLLKAKLNHKKSRKPSPKPFTEEDKQRTRERRQRHYTKRSYEKQLLVIVNDELVPARERHEALFILGRVKGYHRASKSRDS